MSEAATYFAQVRWSDADSLGHLNHTRYLTFFEDGRMALLEGWPRSDDPVELAARGFIAARVCVDYLVAVKPRPGLMLRVASLVSKIGTSSWTITAEMDDDGTPVARSEVVMVAYSYVTETSRPLADDERAYLEKYLRP